jgi:D-glycero-alpha-D-manno-heptose-7-phosphate kinase
MILVKAPLRLSFFGGGSDIPSHFERYGGATLSATFDKWVYATIMYTPQPHVKVAYSTTEYHETASEVRHDIVREALRIFRIAQHIEIGSFADIPTVGTGLGASSAFNVCIVAGLARYKDKRPHQPHAMAYANWVSHTAGALEIYDVKSPIGYQDHIAAAYGGMVFAQYHALGTRLVPFSVSRMPIFSELFECLFLVKMSNRQVSANVILKQGMSTTPVKRLVDMAYQAKTLVERHDVLGFGSLLHDGWMQKKQMHSAISTPEIDDAYDRARRAGALGGKLLGAGNGGYLLLCAKSVEDKRHIQETVFANDVWYNVTPTETGVEIVYDDTRHY